MLSPAALGRGHGDPQAARDLENFFFVTNESLVRRSGTNKVAFDAGARRSKSKTSGGKHNDTNSSSGARDPAGIWRKADVVEPQVIDEEVLKFGIQELHNDDSENGDVDFREIKDFRQIKTLALSYKNIMFIANLETFTGLRVLRLDNNIIEKIEGLDVLVGLEWLDLSFNNVTTITGLTQLVNLTDLSLYANKISTLGGLDACKKLQVFSVGRNNITDLAEIQYLRKFEHLRCLNLEGNKFFSPQNQQQHQQNTSPLQQSTNQQQRSMLHGTHGLLQHKNSRNQDTSQQLNLQQDGLEVEQDAEEEREEEEQSQIEGYVAYVLACLPKLKYLDYQLLDKKKLLAAKEAVQPDDILFDARRENREIPSSPQRDNSNSNSEKLKENFCHFTYDLQHIFFNESVIPQAVKVLKDWTLLKDAFVEKLDMLTQKLRQNFKQRVLDQKKKIAAYEAAARTAILESEEEARLLLKQMQSSKNKALRELRNYLHGKAELQQQADAAKAAAIAADEASFERKRFFSDQPLSTNAGATGRDRKEEEIQGEEQGATAALEDFCRRRAPPLSIAAAAYLKDIQQLSFHLYESETALRDSLSEGLDTLEAAVDVNVKYLLDRGNEYFQSLEEMEKVFSNSLSESAATELDALSLTAPDDPAIDTVSRVPLNNLLHSQVQVHVSIQHLYKSLINQQMSSSGSVFQEILKRNVNLSSSQMSVIVTCGFYYLVDIFAFISVPSKDDLMGACNTIYEQHLQLLISSEDSMQNTITTWQRGYFDAQRQQQHERSRQRVQEIEIAVKELQQEISLMHEQLQQDANAESPALPLLSVADLS